MIWRQVTRLVLGVCLAGLGMVGGGCATDRQVIDQANEMHSGLKPAVMEDARLNNYLQQVGDRILDVGKEMDQQHFGPESHLKEDSGWMYDKKMVFHFVNSDTLNAFTTGGEHMYIYRKLFETCKTEDELAAVMAHEYGHVYARHVHKGMNRQMVMLGAAGAAGAAGYAAGGKEKGMEYAGMAAGLALAAGQFAGMKFTRDDESEADYLGFEFYTRAGWDPKRFGDFFQRMADMGFDKTPEMLSDHPSLKSRKAQADKWASELPANLRNLQKQPVASPAQFAALQRSAVQLGKQMPTDKQLADAQKILSALPRSCLTPVEQQDEIAARNDILQQAQAQQEAQEKAAKPKQKKPKKQQPAT